MARRRRPLSPPAWPDRDGRPRVLVEVGDGALASSVADALDPSSYMVIACAGPEVEQGTYCPLLEGERCPTAAHADVVLVELAGHETDRRGLPAAVSAELREGTSVIVMTAAPVAEREAEALADCRVLCHPVRRDELLAAVSTAVEDLAGSQAAALRHPRPLHWTPPQLP